MCILIYDNRRNKKRLNKAVFERSQKKNPHGMGLMYAYENKLCIWRTLDDLDGLWNRYIYARNRSLSIALHFRKATAGTIKPDNIHPFSIRPGFAFMHNGTAKDIVPYVPHGTSDTKFINSELFQSFPVGFLQSPIHRIAIENLIDGGRMLFMDSKGGFTILNEKRWGASWDKGVWFSKGEHMPYYLYGSETIWVGTSIYDNDDPYYNNYRHQIDWGAKRKEKHSLSQTKHTTVIPFVSTKKDRKARRKLASQRAIITKGAHNIPTSTGPAISHTANLVFDYGYLANVGFYDSRLKVVGAATAADHQLWALGEFGNELPAALPANKSRILGTVYKITKDYRSVMDGIDDVHGCDYKDPAISVYHRRWVKVNLLQGKQNRDVWVWIHRYAMPLESVSTAAIVPMGDWSRFTSPVKEA